MSLIQFFGLLCHDLQCLVVAYIEATSQKRRANLLFERAALAVSDWEEECRLASVLRQRCWDNRAPTLEIDIRSETQILTCSPFAEALLHIAERDANYDCDAGKHVQRMISNRLLRIQTEEWFWEDDEKNWQKCDSRQSYCLSWLSDQTFPFQLEMTCVDGFSRRWNVQERTQTNTNTGKKRAIKNVKTYTHGWRHRILSRPLEGPECMFWEQLKWDLRGDVQEEELLNALQMMLDHQSHIQCRRLENETAFEMFKLMHKRLKRKEIVMAWHGVKNRAVALHVEQQGLMINFSRAKNRWGQGHYLSFDPNVSLQYCEAAPDGSRTIFLAFVAIGLPYLAQGSDVYGSDTPLSILPDGTVCDSVIGDDLVQGKGSQNVYVPRDTQVYLFYRFDVTRV